MTQARRLFEREDQLASSAASRTERGPQSGTKIGFRRWRRASAIVSDAVKKWGLKKSRRRGSAISAMAVSGGLASDLCDRRGDQLAEFSQVLGGDGEVESVVGAIARRIMD